MAFRDDLAAARARGEALERRVAELEAENRRLREGEPEPEAGPEVRIQRGLRGAGLVMLAVTAIVAAVAAGAVFYGQPIVAAVSGMLALLLCFQIVVLAQLLYIAPPNVALVFSGRRYVRGGVERPYRIVVGGRAVRVPLLEHVEALDLRVRPVETSIAGAYCRDGVPIDLKLLARVHIARTEPRIEAAVERFLGRDQEIARVAGETLEGHARALVARLGLAEMQADREKLAAEIIAEAEPDLDKLGLEIESLSVVEVA